ncbi:aromatic prenyltransferase [Nocardia sp. CDC160]|uniref:aromatic prenyltransferase n=1 Tax=Nocardia sp. CDC160 TaxID=3112166 RepID=UPI002DB6B154|nr:aromatic prenyltransferase [Nocardia sp. CDC160]MEC3918359.1 aromatic prenyltransferase [Nocardia sp. CDC160]
MSTVVTLDQLRRDLREFARLAEVDYDPTVVDPILEALEPQWTTSLIGVRTTTHPVARRELNVRFMSSGDNPVPPLLHAGLLEFTGHPMESLLIDIPAAVPVLYGVDAGVNRGLEKIWMLPARPFGVDEILDLPGIPKSVHAHAGHLRAYGGEIAIVALDFRNGTVNLYSQVLPPGRLTTADITTILSDLGFVAATARELELLSQTFNLYRTFSWTDPHMRRICFPVRYQAATFPRGLDPVLDRFVAGAPYAGTGDRGFTFYAAYGPDDRYYKIQTDYTAVATVRLPDGMLPRMN